MATDRCEPIRENIRAAEQNIQEIEEVLPEVVGPAKKKLQEFVKRERTRLRQLRATLQRCEAGK